MPVICRFYGILIVVVDPGGYGISWNDELDMSEYELWTKGIEILNI